MTKTILIIGTLDTKGVEFAYIRDLIAARGHATRVMDAGVMEPQWAADISAAKVASAGGADLGALRAAGDRANALDVMCKGARAVALDLVADGSIDGVISLGGSGGTAIATILPATDGHGDAWTYAYRKAEEFTRVDYALVSPGLLAAVVGECGEIPDTPEVRAASDHRPVLVRLREGAAGK